MQFFHHRLSELVVKHFEIVSKEREDDADHRQDARGFSHGLSKEGDGWTVTAAGPTTSIREEPYQADIIKKYGVRAVIGKGGMGGKTLQALREAGAVYLNAVGGAAQFYAKCIERTDGVSLTEFGTPEAMWHLWVRDFPAIVTMDAHGNSLHKDLEEASGEKLAELRAVAAR